MWGIASFSPFPFTRTSSAQPTSARWSPLDPSRRWLPSMPITFSKCREFSMFSMPSKCRKLSMFSTFSRCSRRSKRGSPLIPFFLPISVCFTHQNGECFCHDFFQLVSHYSRDDTKMVSTIWTKTPLTYSPQLDPQRITSRAPYAVAARCSPSAHRSAALPKSPRIVHRLLCWSEQ